MGKSSKGWLTVDHRKILLDHREEYDDAPEGQDRKQVLCKIKTALKEHEGSLPKQLNDVCQFTCRSALNWLQICQVIDNWYYQLANGGDGTHLDDEPKYTQHWNLKKVVVKVMSEDIKAMIPAPSGSKEFIEKISPTLSQVIQDLSLEDRKKYQKMAKTFNKEGPPREIQIKFVSHTHFIGMLNDNDST